MKRVLVVDDDAPLRAVLTRLLRGMGYRVSVAADGRAGLEALRREPPDILLVDMLMPVLGGVEVCRAVRADPALCRLPVIMLTALGGADDVVAGLDNGADDYILKPFDIGELRARMARLLREGPQTRQPARDALWAQPV